MRHDRGRDDGPARVPGPALRARRDLLRLTLDSGARPHATLDEELAFLEHYLAIQRIRFGSRLRVVQAIDERARRALVPTMSLQPLVENAIRHGLSSRAQGGTVRIAARVEGGSLEVRVEDDGKGLPPGWSLSGSPGRGLSVTRERLDGCTPTRLTRSTSRRAPTAARS